MFDDLRIYLIVWFIRHTTGMTHLRTVRMALKPPQKRCTSPSVRQSFRVPLFSYSNISICKQAGTWLNTKGKTIIKKFGFHFLSSCKNLRTLNKTVFKIYWMMLKNWWFGIFISPDELKDYETVFEDATWPRLVARVYLLRIKHVTPRFYRFFDVSYSGYRVKPMYPQQTRQPDPFLIR